VACGDICHDGIWIERFCGRDAYLVTGSADMNHDCVVDERDLALFQEQYNESGPNLSGDFDGNGAVGFPDYGILVASYGPVPSCTPWVAEPELICNDACDNEGDGVADCADLDCWAEHCVAFTGKLSLRQGSLYYPIAYGGTLTGSGVAAISGSYPVSVAVNLKHPRLPQRAFVAQTTGSLATPPPPYLSFGTQASFANEAGLFGKGGGVGTLMGTAYGSYPTPVGYAWVTPAKNQFGGTLRLLGSLRRQTTRTTGGTPASQGLPLGNVGTGYLSTYVTSSGTYNLTVTTPRAWGARWTTGFIGVSTPLGSYTMATGYDNRTTNGLYGTLRLVSPRLVATGLPPQAAKPGFAVLELHFAPEPTAGILLAVGLLGLAVLDRRRRRANR
jgi:hypothetical protein